MRLSLPVWRAGFLRYAAALVPLLGLLEWGAHHYFAGRAPGFEQWSDIAEPIAELRQADDLVVVAPHWAEPMARRALPDDAMPLRDIARPDTDRYPTALEVSILGQRHPDFGDWHELSRRREGKFTFRRLENPTFRPVVFDFVDSLGPQRTEVRIGPGEGQPCAWRPRGRVLAGGLGGHPTFPAQRFYCRGGSFYNVGATVIADQDWLPRRCLWAHPPAQGALVLRYRGVQLGEVIAGHGGMYWIIERQRKGVPVELSVRVNGQLVGRAIHRDGDGWAGFEFPLGEHAAAADAEVEFAVSAANNRHRHFCFEAISR